MISRSHSLRLVTLILLTLVMVVGVTAVKSAVVHQRSQSNLTTVYISRAIETFNALQGHYYVNLLNLYRGSCSGYACLWPYSQVMSALIYLSLAPGLGNYTRLFNLYYNALGHYVNPLNPSLGYESTVTPPLGPGGDTYYDDNEWVTLALIDMYLITNNTSYLTRAEGLFRFIVSGWSTNESLRCPGGIYWKVGDLSRNTCSNSPAAEAAVELYLITGDPYYLKWGIKIINWVIDCLKSPNDLYYDHINPDGTIDETIWSYNQGTTAAAEALLYEATHNETYLKLAEDSAYASLSYFSQGAIYSQPPEFNAIYFRSIEKVVEVSGNTTLAEMLRNLMLEYANATWAIYRDPETGLITMGQPLNSVSTDDVIIWTAAMVQIYSLIAGSQPPIIKFISRIPKPAASPITALINLSLIAVVVLVIALALVLVITGRVKVMRS